MNMIAMFDEIPAITRYDIKKKNVTDARMGIVKKSIPPVLRGYQKYCVIISEWHIF